MFTSVFLLVGYIIDVVVGELKFMPHPVVLIGRMISFLEAKTREVFKSNAKGEYFAGVVTMVVTVAVAYIVPFILLAIAYEIHISVWVMLNIFFVYQILAVKSLKDSVMDVYYQLFYNGVELGRKSVAMIVGRDTEQLDEAGIVKASIESCSESASDGIIAPMFFIMLGGAPLGFAYKAVNTLDSMVGYRNDKYINFGRSSAMLDDICNYIPSRITGLLYVVSAYINKMDYKNAWKIFLRDRHNHASPNSAQSESACAGALGIQLGGDAYYFGELKEKLTIGDDLKVADKEDIKKSIMLLSTVAFLGVMVMGALALVLHG